MRATLLGKKIALSFQALAMALGFLLGSLGLAAAAPALAACDPGAGGIQSGADCAQPAGTSGNLFSQGGIFQTVANVLIFLVGAIAVIFLIIGGLRYVISNGDSKNVEAAKNTILYAIVGIVVAVISYALVTFVITSLAKAQAGA